MSNSSVNGVMNSSILGVCKDQICYDFTALTISKAKGYHKNTFSDAGILLLHTIVTKIAAILEKLTGLTSNGLELGLICRKDNYDIL